MSGSSKTDECLDRSWSSMDFGTRDSLSGGGAWGLEVVGVFPWSWETFFSKDCSTFGWEKYLFDWNVSQPFGVACDLLHVTMDNLLKTGFLYMRPVVRTTVSSSMELEGPTVPVELVDGDRFKPGRAEDGVIFDGSDNKGDTFNITSSFNGYDGLFC